MRHPVSRGLLAGLVTFLLATGPAQASHGVIGGLGGPTGNAEGEFSFSNGGPGGVAVNVSGAGGVAAGSVYVVDRGNNRIQHFSSSGSFVRTFGRDVGGPGVHVCTSACGPATASSAAAGMNRPQGLAIDQETGQVFVTDQSNRRVDVFSAVGVFEGAFGWGVDTGAEAFEFCTTASGCEPAGASGGNGGQFGTLIGYPAVNPKTGRIVVANRTNRRVDEFEVSGDPATGATFIRAYGFDVVASGPDDLGSAYEVCDLAANPTNVCQQGASGSAAGQFSFSAPHGVAVDGNGHVYAIDTSNDRITKFGTEAEVISAFGSGVLDPWSGVLDIAVDQSADRVLVVVRCNSDVCPDAIPSFERRVVELDAAGFLRDTHLVDAGLTSVSGVAAGPANDYLSTSSFDFRGVLLLGSPRADPTATIEPVTDITPTAAAFSGTVNPTGFTAGYHFEYTADGSTWSSIPASDVGVGGGVVDVAVSQAVTGLAPRTTYQVRLVATKLYGAGTASAETTFKTLDAPPTVTSASFSDITRNSARLVSEINPRNLPSSYRFEYGVADCSENPCTSVPAAGGSIESGSTPVMVSSRIDGLQPDTEYSFRVVTSNAAGTTASDTRKFRTYAEPAAIADGDFAGEGFLPHDRAWEMVSPPEKNGYDVLMDSTRLRAARSDTALPMAAMFSSFGAFADARSSGGSADYVSQRTLEPGTRGWRTHAVMPLQEPIWLFTGFNGQEPLYVGEASDDLGKAVFRTWSPLPGTPADVEKASNLELRSDLRSAGDGTYQLLTDCDFACSLDDPNRNRLPAFTAASDDFDHVLIESRHALTEDAAPDQDNLYKWERGSIRNIGYIPVAPATSCTGAGPGCVVAPKAVAGTGAFRNGHFAPHVLTADGSSAFFTVKTQGVTGDIYVRDDQGTPNTDDDTTFQLNASERAIADTKRPATYWDAAADGSRAFFTSSEALTDDAPIGSTVKLYMWSRTPGLNGTRLTYLSADDESEDALGTVEGTLGVSDAGDHLYFLQRGQIVAGEPLLGSSIGIYVWRDDIGVRYVGEMVDSTDRSYNVTPSVLGSRVTPDGQSLLVTLHQPPGPDGMDHGHCEERGGTLIDGRRGCPHLYLYDAMDGDEPECISCNRTRSPASTPAQFDVRRLTALATPTNHLNNPISEDGRYVFFSTGERLVAADTNGVTDVYVYDADDGRQSLISSGSGKEPSYFMDSSADGADVFFVTQERLSGWDVDDNVDVYDARMHGGVPEPAEAAVQCQGDSCQPPPEALSDLPAASAAFSGPGNPQAISRRCGKQSRRAGGRRGRGRCAQRGRRCRRAAKRARRSRKARCRGLRAACGKRRNAGKRRRYTRHCGKARKRRLNGGRRVWR